MGSTIPWNPKAAVRQPFALEPERDSVPKLRQPEPLPAPSSGPPGPWVGDNVLAWYDRHRRHLPWRAGPGETADPYAVWLSEIMLQQTTVQAVKPFFRKFLALWPTVGALAAASLDDVLKGWAGLGYYSRARNLHACAVAVVRDHGGRFPSNETALRGLPGVGAYTAAAVAAIAFGRRATVVDGNVERVMARLHAVDTPLPRAKPILFGHMDDATQEDRAGDFAQGVMDLGATICTPRNPACAICPLTERCAGRRSGEPTAYPVRAPKHATPVRRGLAYYVRNERGDVLLRTRPATGLLGGMSELPGPTWIDDDGPGLSDLPAGHVHLGRVTHTFTHFTLLLDVVSVPALVAITLDGDLRWVADDAVDDQALPTLMRNALAVARNATQPINPRREPAESRTRRRN